MKSPTVKIVVATHKKYYMPQDKIYLPLHVGAEGKKDETGDELDLGYRKDNTGDNISELNSSFCELTGMYWAWKNLEADYIGLVHYRRCFAADGHAITYEELEPYLGQIKIFTPKKRKYIIETLESHYSHTHDPEHLDVTKAVLIEKFPNYEAAYDRAVSRTWGYMFNMMIMEKRYFCDYCAWLFAILFEVYEKIDSSNYSEFAKRYVGRISELLFNVWIDQQLKSGAIKKSEVKELSCNIEENWLVKVPAFLNAKFFGKKYGNSF